MARVKLSDVTEALELQSEQVHGLFDRQRGAFVTVSEDYLLIAEGEKEDLSEYPDWEREEIETARQVADDDGTRFIGLPNRFEINEWEMMRDFIDRLDDDRLAGRLDRATHGRGAFRRFKDCLHDAGRIDEWYAYRDSRYRDIALEWCEEHGLDVQPEA